jgi:hypothetical protein
MPLSVKWRRRMREIQAPRKPAGMKVAHMAYVRECLRLSRESWSSGLAPVR